MKPQKTQGRMRRFFTRTLVYAESPASLFSSIWVMIRKAVLPTKANPEEFALFRKLSQEERWEKVKKPSWTDEQLAKERTWNCYIATLALICSCTIVIISVAAFKHMTVLQFVGALAYAGAAFLFFAKKSMWVYALENRKVILYDEWLKLPSIWIPVP